MSVRSILTSCVEVERKFLPSKRLCRYLGLSDGKEEGGQPLRLDFIRLPDQWIRDTYYDINDQLSSNGIWIRKRVSGRKLDKTSLVATQQYQTAWEAKIRLGGDTINSQFHEIKGEALVRSLICQHFSGTTLDDLNRTADLETHRKTWTVQNLGAWKLEGGQAAKYTAGKLHVVLDETKEAYESHMNGPGAFKHLVGEVESTETVIEGANEQEHEEARRRAAERMDVVLQDFMSKHVDLFLTSQRVTGKLSAYFAWKNK